MERMIGGIAKGLDLGNIGMRFRGIPYNEIVDNFPFFLELFDRHKVLCFRGIDLTPAQQSNLTHALYHRRLDWPNEGGAQPGLLLEQCHSGNQKTQTDDVEGFIYQQWHVDNPFIENVPSCMSIVMTKFDCKPPAGATHFISLIDMFNKAPEIIRDRLAEEFFVPSTGNIDHAGNTIEPKPIPALRTHPATGETSLFWTGGATTIAKPDAAFSEDLRGYVDWYIQDQANRFSWDWEIGDAIFWDNRCTLHSFSPGWTHDQRVFTRCEAGGEKPFYDPMLPSKVEGFVGIAMSPSETIDYTSPRPNPDHIPLVFTKGIYAHPDFSQHYQKVALFVYSENGEVPEDCRALEELVGDPDFRIQPVIPSENDPLVRYSKMMPDDVNRVGQKFLFTRNGDTWRPYLSTDNILSETPLGDDTLSPISLVRVALALHPDLRHAGHAWHYPDWKKHQPLQFRAWDFHNLSFYDYINFNGEDPPKDFLVQFAIDTVYGCFNHIRSNESRKELIEEIRDFLSLMIELGEYDKNR